MYTVYFIFFCSENDILKDFLSSERAEVEKVILTEYDEEKHIKSIRRFYQAQEQQVIQEH